MFADVVPGRHAVGPCDRPTEPRIEQVNLLLDQDANERWFGGVHREENAAGNAKLM